MSSKDVILEVKNEPKPQRFRSRSRARNRSRSRGRSPGRTTTGMPNREVVQTWPRGRGRGRGRGPPFRGGRGWFSNRGQFPRGRGRGVGAQLAREQREINAVKSKVKGPKVARTMTGVLTIGTVAGNSGETLLERKYHVNMHPALLKDYSAGSAMTPLTDTAADFSYWRVSKCDIKLLKLVNANIVTGSIIIASLDQDGESAKFVNIDDLLTRPHSEVPIGGRMEWKVPHNRLAGQRQGWWLTDTNEEGNLSLGPAIDIHVYGKTMDLLNTGAPPAPMPAYEGPLYLFQISYTYEFANWEPKPAMKVMEAQALPAENVTIKEDAAGELTVEVTDPTGKWERVTSSHETHMLRGGRSRGHKKVLAGESLGSTVFQIVTQAAETAASVVPGPWSWLVKGGLWFLRRFYNPTLNENTIQFFMYPSVSQAQGDERITNSGITNPVTFKDEDGLNLLQINTTNLQNNSLASGLTLLGPDPPVPIDNSFPLSDNITMHTMFVSPTGEVLPDAPNLHWYWQATFNIVKNSTANGVLTGSTSTVTKPDPEVICFTVDKVGTAQTQNWGCRPHDPGPINYYTLFVAKGYNSAGPSRVFGFFDLNPGNYVPQTGYPSAPVNYMMGQFGNADSLLNFLTSQPTSVNSISGFHRASQKIDTSKILPPSTGWWMEMCNTDQNWPGTWVAACQGIFHDRPTARWGNDDAIIIVNTIMKTCAVFAWTPAETFQSENKTHTIAYTGAWNPTSKVRFAIATDTDSEEEDETCTHEGACNCNFEEEQHSEDLEVLSYGDYCASLTPEQLQRELEVVTGALRRAKLNKTPPPTDRG